MLMWGGMSSNVWMMLNRLDSGVTRYVQRACAQIAKAKQLSRHLVQGLQKHIAVENEPGAWILLAELSQHVPEQFDTAALLAVWHQQQEGGDGTRSILNREKEARRGGRGVWFVY